MIAARFVLLAMACLSLVACGTAQPEAPMSAPTVDVSGTWMGEWPSSFGQLPFRLTLKQVGANVTGDIAIIGSQQHSMVSSGPVRGVVSGDRFTFTSPRGADGDTRVQGAEMRGTTGTGLPLMMRR
jgi:Archaea-specific pyridoxal phosphate-dependent enzymes